MLCCRATLCSRLTTTWNTSPWWPEYSETSHLISYEEPKPTSSMSGPAGCAGTGHCRLQGTPPNTVVPCPSTGGRAPTPSSGRRRASCSTSSPGCWSTNRTEGWRWKNPCDTLSSTVYRGFRSRRTYQNISWDSRYDSLVKTDYVMDEWELATLWYDEC